MSCNTDCWATKEYESCVFTDVVTQKKNLIWDCSSGTNLYVLRHVHTISFTQVSTMNVNVCVFLYMHVCTDASV